jgi:eukaryotic-like serine/threonine-protein kinase
VRREVMSELPALIGRKYRPLRVIGRGGMGLVYEVVHENTGEHLALKVLLARSQLAPELVERFRREARATASVKSEHVVRVTDADVAPELDGAPFLVMELLQGNNFEDLCHAREPSPEETVDWLRQVARALDKAHQQQIVHRDLKPENLFLAEREDLPPIVKVLDFGIAKIMGTAGSGTVSGQILGTPRYMAPEQAGPGGNEISPASDRYALGLIAFRLLSNRHYFDQGHLVKLLLEVARGPMLVPSAIGCGHGPAFDTWFARACAREPNARFESCFRQVEALAGALGLSVTSAPVGDASPGNAAGRASERRASVAATIGEAPTLEASVVTKPPSRAHSSRSKLRLTVGIVGAAALAIGFALARTRSDANAVGGSSPPSPSIAIAVPVATRAVDAASARGTVKVEANASATPSLLVASAAPAMKPQSTPGLASSSSSDDQAALPKPKPKPKPRDSVWDEP